MKFSLITLCLAAGSLAFPIDKRAVFTTTSYNDLSISGGKAGNAANEALQKLGGLPTDLKQVEKADLDFLNSVNSIANDAETQVFNPAIEAASGEAAAALRRAKIKNKVLKLTATMLKLRAQEAQGQDVGDKIEAENNKLQNNIRQDVEAAGLPTTFLSFDATTK